MLSQSSQYAIEILEGPYSRQFQGKFDSAETPKDGDLYAHLASLLKRSLVVLDGIVAADSLSSKPMAGKLFFES